jgi:hypothetical protein
MSYPLMSSPTFFGEVFQGATVGAAWDTTPIQACRRMSYINSTNQAITVVQRSGLRVSIPPKPSMRSSGFIVRTEWSISPEVKENVRAVLNGVDDGSSAELKLLKQALLKSDTDHGFYAPAKLILDHPISVEQLKQNGRSVYHHEADVVLSLLSVDTAPLHPYSEAGRNAKMMVDAPVKVGGASFGYCVEIVDNTGRFGDRFVNVADQVYRVRPIRDITRRDGIYIGSSETDTGIFVPGEYKVRCIPLDSPDHEANGIFSSHEGAKHLGDLSGARKRELADIEHATAQLRRENDQLKQAHAIEIGRLEHDLKVAEALQKEAEFQRNRRQAELEEERKRIEHILTLDRIRTKDRYDEKSMDRKDRSEALKMLPTIIVGIGAAIPIIMKLVKPS